MKNVAWNKVKVGSLCTRVTSGGTPKSTNAEYYDNGKIPWLNSKEVNFSHIYSTEKFITEKGLAESSAKWIEKNSVIVAMYGATAGQVAIAKIPLTTNQACCNLTIDDKLADYRYVYYYLWNQYQVLSGLANGGAQQNLNAQIIKEFEIQLPELSVQKSISEILFSLDEQIRINNTINHNLEEQAKALYDQIWDNYDSGTWSSAKAEDLFDISIGKTPPRKESQWFSENDNDIVWVSIADMGQSGCFISNSSEYLTPDAVSKFNVKRVPAGAILLSFKLTVGRVAITGCELTTNEAIAHFRMEDSTIREYLYFYLKHFNYQTMGSTSSIATAVNSKMVKAMCIDIPARETLENFHSTVFPMFEQIKQNQQEIQTLAQLRDTLLPKLMSGELDVSEVEV